MPLLIGVIAVLALIAIVAVCRRLVGFRADEHAMESYEHALDVLGDASRRTESQRVRIVPSDEVAKPHFQATDATAPVPRPGSSADVPPPRVRLEPPVLPGVAPAEGGPAPALAFDDVDAGPPVPARRGSRRPRPGRVPSRPDPRRARRLRLGATGGLAVVAAGAVAVAALQLSGGPTKANATNGTVGHHGSRPTATTAGGGRGGGPASTTSLPPATSTTTTLPSAIVPQTSSATDVSYRAPAPTYTLTFQASAPCWVGVQQTTGGPWVWEETVQAGQMQTYSASGSIIVRLGAPRAIRVSVDGVTVQLPPSNVQPYNLTFTPNS